MTWPLGDAPFAVDDLLAAGRALDQAARADLPLEADRHGLERAVGQALEIIDTLSAYVASLPAEEQQATARELVVALNERSSYTATVRRRR